MNSDVLGYGEDALTLWSLCTARTALCAAMKQAYPSFDQLEVAIYRPSFGRGRYGWGELDAIIASNDCLYLVEAKWEQSQEVRNATITLREEQQRRHKIIRWLHQRWKSDWKDWLEMRDNCDQSFKILTGRELPKTATILWPNICSVMSKCSSYQKCENTVLLFVDKTNIENVKVEYKLDETHSDFKLVKMSYSPSKKGSQYFLIGSEGSSEGSVAC